MTASAIYTSETRPANIALETPKLRAELSSEIGHDGERELLLEIFAEGDFGTSRGNSIYAWTFCPRRHKRLAARLAKACEAGAAFKNFAKATDHFGGTYLTAKMTGTFTGRWISSELKRAGF